MSNKCDIPELRIIKLKEKNMYKNRLIFVVIIIIAFTVKCTNPSYELTGLVQNGLDGEALPAVEVELRGTSISAVTDKNGNFSLKVPYSATPGVRIEEINSTAFLKNNTKNSYMVLVAGKSGYQQLEYQVSSRTTGLVLNILPEPTEFKAIIPVLIYHLHPV